MTWRHLAKGPPNEKGPGRPDPRLAGGVVGTSPDRAPVGPKSSLAPLTRLEHVSRHVPEPYREFIPWLCEPLTQARIAEQMGAGYTPRQVQCALQRVSDSVGLAGHHTPLRRVKLLRMAAGLDPCFCEAEE